MRRAIAQTGLALLTAVAVAVGVLYPTDFAAAAGYPSDGVNVAPSMPGGVPVYEPQVGRGGPLRAGVTKHVPLGKGASEAHSALVRLSVFTAESDLTISLAGTPALSVAKGRSASTSLLVPVRNGKVDALSSGEVNARIEVLALFDAAGENPGATVAITDPVTRADTAAGLGESTVGLLGLGGVPSEQVRAVYVTVISTATAASTVVVDGQSLSVPRGTSVLSTVVTPSASGDVDISVPATASVRIDVRGYVAEAAQHENALNGRGSYWPLPAGDWDTFATSDAHPAALNFDLPTTGGSVLALMSSTPARELTLLDAAKPYNGRAQGAIVDPVTGTALQLVLIPAEEAKLLLRRGSVSVKLLLLGSFLGDGGVSADPTITITTPTATEIDASEHVTFDFDGTLETPGSEPLRVEATLNGAPYGAAEIAPSESGIGWHFTAAVPTTGDYEFAFKITDRDGGTATTSWSGRVVMPSADDTVTAANAFVIGTPGHMVNIIELADDWVSFDGDPGVVPGDVIASNIAPNAPAGFLRTVLAVDVTGDVWKLTTTFATLEDAFLQLDLDYIANPDMPDPASVTRTEQPGDPDVTIESDTFQILPISEMDVDPYLGTAVEVPGVEVAELTGRTNQSELNSADRIMGLSPSSVEMPALMRSAVQNTFEPTWGWSETIALSQGAQESGPVGASLQLKSSTTTQVTTGFRVAIKITFADSPFPLVLPTLNKLVTSKFTRQKTTSEGKVTFGVAFTKEMPSAIYTFRMPPITIPTPIPIIFVTGIDVNLLYRVKATLDGSFSYSSSSQSESEQGSSYLNGVVTKIDRGPTNTYKPMELDGPGLTGTVEVSGGIQLRVDFLLYDLSGPRILIELMAGLTASAGVTAGSSLSATVKLQLFLEATLALQFIITVPFTTIDLLNITVIKRTFRHVFWEVELDRTVAFSESELGGGGEEHPAPDDDTTSSPPPPLCEASTEGTVRYVCTGSEFVAAIANPAFTTVALAQSVDTWSSAVISEYDCDRGAAPQGLTVTVARSVAVNMQGHQLCLHGVKIVDGANLTVADHPWGYSDGRLMSQAAPSSDEAGISTTGGRLTVRAGRVLAIGDGGGAGIGGDSGHAAGTLYVFGGSVDGNGGGDESYNPDPEDGGAGIGGGSDGSGGLLFLIDGDVDGSSGDGAAGVGGGARGNGGSVSVYGGALSGWGYNRHSGSSHGGAGIGGGVEGNGAYLLVSAGDVIGDSGAGAGAGTGGAGIGGGWHGYGASTVITGGKVNAQANVRAGTELAGAGIGGGYGASGGTVAITGGRVNVYSESQSAGIGGGAHADGGSITISGGTIDTFAASGDMPGGGAGIGGGVGANSGEIRISNATISAAGHDGGTGIGAGSGGNSTPITIRNAIVNSFAVGYGGAAGLGSGAGGTTGAISIIGGRVSAWSDHGGAGIGGGAGSIAPDITIENADVRTGIGGIGGGAGIGGGSGSDSGAITIRNSTIYALGQRYAAAIGGGNGGDSGPIVIVGSEVDAYSNYGGAGLGGGANGNAGPITITDSEMSVAASGDSTSENGGAALGGGADGNAGTITISNTTGDFYGSSTSAVIGGGARGNGGTVVIDADSVVYVQSNGGNGIGQGVGGTSFGSLDVQGDLELTDTTITLLPDAAVVVGGTIRAMSWNDPDYPDGEFDAFIDGVGTIQNNGVIRVTVADTVTVTGVTHTVTFDPNNPLAVDPAQTVRVFASTFNAGRRELATPPTIVGYTFLGWNRKADGTGTPLKLTDVLTGDFTVYAIWKVG